MSTNPNDLCRNLEFFDHVTICSHFSLAVNSDLNSHKEKRLN